MGSELTVNLGWDVKSKSVQEDEFSRMCIVSFMDMTQNEVLYFQLKFPQIYHCLNYSNV